MNKSALALFAISARLNKLTKTSFFLVYITLISFCFSNSLPTCNAMDKAIFFSKYPLPVFPGSLPPCPASNTTVNLSLEFCEKRD